MKLAVLGGTFDPVHRAHLQIADEVIRRLGFDQVLLMVAPRPPHKRDGILTGAFHRYTMAVLASQEEERVVVSGLELERPGPSYTIDTMSELRSIYPGAALAFVAGGDSLRDIRQWREYGRLLSEFSLIFVPRHGLVADWTTIQNVTGTGSGLELVEMEHHFEPNPGRSCLLRVQIPDISSTTVREEFRCGREPGPGILHPEVLRYIHKYRLYGLSQANTASDLRSD